MCVCVCVCPSPVSYAYGWAPGPPPAKSGPVPSPNVRAIAANHSLIYYIGIIFCIDDVRLHRSRHDRRVLSATTNSAKNSLRLCDDAVPRLSPRQCTPFEVDQIRQHSRRYVRHHATCLNTMFLLSVSARVYRCKWSSGGVSDLYKLSDRIV